MAEPWINKKGWLRGYVPEKRQLAEEEEVPALHESAASKEAAAPYGVVYHPIKCPKCGSKDTKCYSSAPPIRYHKCRNCDYRFKSQESLNLKNLNQETPAVVNSDPQRTVIFVMAKCPKCGSKKLRCYGVQDNIRYYKCNKCKVKFKAFEKDLNRW